MAITFTEAVGGPVPAVEIEINLQGVTGLLSGEQIRSIIVVAERVATGDLAANAVSSTAFADADAGIAAFGDTSPGAAMVAAIYDYYNSETKGPKCEVWGAALAEKGAGTAPVQKLTIAGAATAAGVLTLRIGGHLFAVPITNGMAVADQATAIRDAFNNAPTRDRPPLVATALINGAGPNWDFILTGSVKCAHMNNIALETVSKGSIGTSAYTWSGTTMGSAGGTPGAGNYAAGDFTTVLAALQSFNDAAQYVIPWSENGNAAAQAFDDTVASEFRDHVILMGNANNMTPAYLRMAWKSTAAKIVDAIGTLDTNDCERVSVAACPYSTTGGSGTWDGEIAAQYAAMRASETHLARPFNGLKFTGVAVPNSADNWTQAELKTLLEGGASPLWVPPFKSDMEICRDVSCRMDLGVLDTQVMDALDYIRSDFAAALNANRRMGIVSDDVAPPPVEWISQPKAMKALLRARAEMLQNAGYLTNVETDWDGVIYTLSGSTLSLAIPVSLIPPLHNIMTRLDADVPPGA